ncbi:pentapeptide repeat protein [Nitrosomonas oligotropha]|uniref:Pentapeptide repeat protein n=1 Tax=Nitrosomonas oligotropha TaxID=42354 RepID=A0A2T5I4H9_9PROT|nr:P-loop NTPase fold protein [Nitrosomonas oligotropha]PTQ78716.1 pentapeptide repeat protein [Nitrosomonas oligotropha]
MSKLSLLGDQPARIDSDRLHFQRYLSALETAVLNRDGHAPFVTGIFGPWGSGKSTLLGMLEHRLTELNRNTVNGQSNWVTIKFSPWLYSQEESLLVPLLALLAQKESVFKPLIKKMTETSMRFLKRTSATLDFDKLGMPLKISLNNLAQGTDGQHKFFQEEIAAAIKTITGKKRLVFLIDDLDRCHDPAQIVHLLEQIKLFLHLDGCLFFIAADRQQVVDAIDKTFPGSGAAYLEKFVQLAFDLPPHHSEDLVRMLPSTDAETLRAYRPLCEVLGNNPRKLKLIWNEAVLRMAILKEELHTHPQARQHTPDLNLLLHWLLIRNRGELAKNPYRYLEFEQSKKTATQEEQQELRKEFSRMLQLADDTGQWYSEEDQRLAVFLWNRLDQVGFHHPAILTLYTRASGTDTFYSRNLLENACFVGGDEAQFNDRDFFMADLSGGYFPGAVFNRCDFTGADFRHSILNRAQFADCDLSGVCFDEATLDSVTWENCTGLNELDTEPVLYEQIIDSAAATYLKTTTRNPDIGLTLVKAYKTILDKHKESRSLTEAIESRLNGKALQLRAEIYLRQT